MSRGRALRRVALLIPVCGVVVAALFTVAWVAIGRPQIAGGATWFKVEKVGSAHYSGSPTQPFFFLAVGNDSRPGGPGGARGDAIHLIGVNPSTHQASMIDIPRDTSAAIPGHGTDKINASFSYGGIELEAQTVGNLVGVDIPYAITTDFDGFTAMIDAMGGIDINVPTKMNDTYSGAFFDPGPQHLNGDEALRFSRDRHDFDIGDLKRSENQGLLIMSALTTLERKHPGDHGILRLIAILAAHTQLQGMGITDLYRLGHAAFAIDPGQVRNVVLPVGGGSGSNLAVGSDAQSLFADFRDDAVLQNH